MTLRGTLRPLTRTIRSVVGTNGLTERVAALELAVNAASKPSAQPGPVQVDAATPPATEPVSPVAEPSTAASPKMDINQLLHDSRGALLRGMPPGAECLLSAGCAGLWYFEWIEQTYGPVAKHLGIEFFSPKPDGLPANVTWIANTASDMSSVADQSCDLVFSGQNLEHLWPEEVAGFTLEAARVLRPGGCLVIDSPNRLVTAAANWSHPEHTIELTPAEVVELVELAGFDVTSMYGIWLCHDARTGRALPFDPNEAVAGWSLTERLLVARDRPGESFIWWLEAVRVDRVPDAAAVHALMARLFRDHWPERVQRLVVPPGHERRASPDGEWVVSAPGQTGVTMFGPYMPLRAGRHRVTWQVQSAHSVQLPVAICDVARGPEGDPIARCEVRPGAERVSIEFELKEMTFGMQFRCFSTGGPGFSVLRRVELDEHIK